MRKSTHGDHAVEVAAIAQYHLCKVTNTRRERGDILINAVFNGLSTPDVNEKKGILKRVVLRKRGGTVTVTVLGPFTTLVPEE